MLAQSNIPVLFLAFANDHSSDGSYLRNLPEEIRQLRAVLKIAEANGLCELVLRTNTTIDELLAVFRDPKYRNRIAIFHYAGHANGFQLLLEDAGKEGAAADAGGLARFLAMQEGLQLVVLNGCATRPQVRGLLDANIPAVIATSQAIDDDVATEFASHFYKSLASGARIDTAYHEAAAVIETRRGGNPRTLYLDSDARAGQLITTEHWPWELHIGKGAEEITQWNLPDAVSNPLFGLPDLPLLDLPPSPYRYLDPFTAREAAVFFGRGHQIRMLFDRLTTANTHPIVLFYGQPGVGKSSLLDAGVLPRLEQAQVVRYARRGNDGLSDTLHKLLVPEGSGLSQNAAWLNEEKTHNRPLTLILDQVEECFTRRQGSQPTELDQLLVELKEIFIDGNQRPQGKVVLGFRKDWLHEVESRIASHRLPTTRIALEPLDRQGVIEVVNGPTKSDRLQQTYGLNVEVGLGEMIADGLLGDHGSALAPTLQVLLTKMWDIAKEQDYTNPCFDQDLFRELERKGILLDDFLKQQIAAFRTRYPQVVDSGLLLDILVSHTTALGTAGQCSQEKLQEQYAHTGATLFDLLQHCQDLHLLTVVGDIGSESAKTMRLAHDTLAPLVRKYYDESDLPGQRARRILDNRSVDWADGKTGTPLDEADLAVVEKGVKGTKVLSLTEQRLLEVSRELRKSRQRNRKWVKLGGMVAVLAIILALGVSIYQVIETKKQERLALIQLGNTEWQRAVSARDFELDDVRSAHLFTAAARAYAYADKPERAKNSLVAIPDGVIRSFPHYDGIADAVFSGDGSKVLSWDYGNSIRLWDIAQDEPIRTFEHDNVIGAVFSNNGLLILSWDDDISMRLWNIAQDEPIRTFKRDGVKSAVFSANGSQLLSWNNDNSIQLWDIAQDEPIRTFKHDIVTRAIFNRDGSRVLSWGLDDSVRLWDIAQDEPIRTFKHDSVKGAAFNGEETQVLSWGDNEEDGIRLWDITRDEPALSFQHNGVMHAMFNGDGSHVLSRSYLDGIRLWNIAENELIHTFKYDDTLKTGSWYGENAGATFIYNGLRVMSWGYDDSVRLWDISQNEPYRTFKHDRVVVGAVLNDDGARLLSWDDNDTVRLWNVARGKLIRTFKHDRVEGAMFNGDDSSILIWSDNNRIRLWDSARVGAIRIFDHDGIEGAVFNDDETQVLSWGLDDNIHLWNIAQDEPIRTFKHHRVRGAVFNDDETHVLSWAPKGGSVRLWDIANNDPIRNFKHDGVIGAVFSGDGSRVLSWDNDNSIRLWDIAQDEPIRTFKHVTVNGVVFNDDGSQVLSWGGNSVQMWDIGQNMPIRTFKHDMYGVMGAVFYGDGSQVLSWGRFNGVRLWDIAQDEPIRTFKHDGVIVFGATSNDNETHVLSWGNGGGGSVRLWDVSSDEPIRTFKHDRVEGAAFDENRSQVLSWGDDDRVRLWDFAQDEPIKIFKHDRVKGAAFDENRSQVLSWGDDDSVRLWDFAQDEPIRTYHHDGAVGAVFKSDGSQVLSWGNDHRVRLWGIPNYDDASIDLIEAFKLNLETRTAATITEQGAYRLLNFSEWLEKRNKLPNKN